MDLMGEKIILESEADILRRERDEWKGAAEQLAEEIAKLIGNYCSTHEDIKTSWLEMACRQQGIKEGRHET
jgi:hypothetical protein